MVEIVVELEVVELQLMDRSPLNDLLFVEVVGGYVLVVVVVVVLQDEGLVSHSVRVGVEATKAVMDSMSGLCSKVRPILLVVHWSLSYCCPFH